MRRSMLLATSLAAGLLLLGATTATAQSDPYAATSKPAIDYAAGVASQLANATDLVLVTIEDAGQTVRFTEPTGTSSAWEYAFYSPSLDSLYIVRVAGLANIVFRTLGSASIHHAEAVPMTALDTSGAFVTSEALATALAADADYQQYQSEHPGAPRGVRLSNFDGAADYPPPASIPTDLPAWTVTSAAVGDSVHLCYFATGTGALACSTYFYKGIPLYIGASGASNVDFRATNIGHFGGDYATGTASFEAPVGSGNKYIFGAGLWVGANKRVNGTLQPRVFITYDPNSGQSWATAGDGWMDRSAYSVPALFNSLGHDPATGDPSGPGEFRWPLWQTDASATPSYLRPGTFVPMNSDRVAGGPLVGPAFVPGVAEQFVSRYSDANTARYEEQIAGFPLGLQFQENIYGMPGDLDHTVIVAYDVVNMSSDTLYDVVLGSVTDFDIGTNSANDRSRFYTQSPELRTAVAWSTPEATVTPLGALAITLLEAPMTGEGGFITNDQREAYQTDGRVGTYQSWKLEEDPSTSIERYSFMTSGNLDQSAGVGDYRGLLASTKFNMLPGDTAHFAVSFVVNRGLAATTGADETFADRIRSVTNAYYGEPFSGVEMPATARGGLSLSVVPNPASERVTLTVSATSGAAAEAAIFDHLGARVMSADLGSLRTGSNIRSLDVSMLPAGAYLVVTTSGGTRAVSHLVIAR